LRDIARRVLARAGFDVISAAGPDEAILAAESSTDGFDLLLTDVVMPGMRGPQLATRLRARQPDLRVLLVSGYAEEIVEGERDASLPFLAKPFSAESLLAAIELAMHGSGDDQDDETDPPGLVATATPMGVAG